MIRLSTRAGILVALAALTMVAPAPAADDVLDAIPNNALGFYLVNGPAAAGAKVADVAAKMQFPPINPWTMLKLQTGLGKGLDEAGSTALVVVPGEQKDSKPVVLWLVPTNDFNLLVESSAAEPAEDGLVALKLAKVRVVAAECDGFAVIGEEKHRQVVKRTVGAKKGVPGDVASWKAWLLENDFAAVVTADGMKLLARAGQQGLKAAQAAIESTAPANNQVGEILGVYDKLFAVAGREVSAFAVAARISESGDLLVSDRLRFTAGGKIAQMFADAPVSKGDLFDGIPSGPFVVAFAGIMTEEMGVAMMDFSIEVMKSAPKLYGIDESNAEKLSKLFGPMMIPVKSMSMSMALGKPSDSFYSNTVAVMKVTDADQYLVDYKKYMDAFVGLIDSEKATFFPQMKAKNIEFNGRPGLQISMQMPKFPGGVQVPNYDKMMEKMLGPGGQLKAFLVAIDKETVVLSYTNKAMLRRSIAALGSDKSGFSSDSDTAKTAALLPAGAPWVGYWSIGGTVDFVNQMSSAFMPEGVPGFTLPEFPAAPPIGFAVTAGAHQVEGTMVVPGAVLTAAGEYAKTVRQAFGAD